MPLVRRLNEPLVDPSLSTAKKVPSIASCNLFKSGLTKAITLSLPTNTLAYPVFATPFTPISKLLSLSAKKT